MDIDRCDGEVERVFAHIDNHADLPCRAAGRPADALVSALGSHCRLMVSRCRGINHDAFKINAARPLRELLKQFCPNAPLGPTVKFGVNASPFAALGARPSNATHWQRYKGQRRETRCCPWRGGLFPKMDDQISIMRSSVFSQKKTPPARCLFFFSAFCAAPLSRKIYWESLREVLMPFSVGVVCAGSEKSKEKLSIDH